MIKKQRTKLVFILVLFSSLLFSIVFLILSESGRCMGCKVVEKSFLDSYTLGSKFDTDKILFEGKKVPSDEKWERIYISQPETSLDSYKSFVGSLQAMNTSFTL